MAQLIVHGTSYEMPESFTLKEMRILERYSEGHVEGYDISKMCAVIHIAIMRAKPELSFSEIQDVVDELPVEDLEGMFAEVESAGQSPPAPSKSESNGSSTESSEPSSDATPESETPEPSGSPDLAGFQSFHSRSAS
jgi:hypothetical protein